MEFVSNKIENIVVSEEEKVLKITWDNMMQRCYNPKHPEWKNYGGRRIKISKSWHQFENFCKDMGVRPKGLTIERIDNDKGYSKKNCKWATQQDQIKNKRCGYHRRKMPPPRLIEQEKKSNMTLREWLNTVRLSVSSFATLLKVDRSYVHAWLRGSKIPSKWIIARVKQVTMDQVTELEDKKEDKNGKKESV